MRVLFALALVTGTSVMAMNVSAAATEKRCRMEQQCRWVNFKKVCNWVKVCREH